MKCMVFYLGYRTCILYSEIIACGQKKAKDLHLLLTGVVNFHLQNTLPTQDYWVCTVVFSVQKRSLKMLTMLITDFKMLTVQCVILLFQWRYCIRIENLGQETVQLRERHWRIFSLSGTLETVRGRGVAGQVRLVKVEGREGKGKFI